MKRILYTDLHTCSLTGFLSVFLGISLRNIPFPSMLSIRFERAAPGFRKALRVKCSPRSLQAYSRSHLFIALDFFSFEGDICTLRKIQRECSFQDSHPALFGCLQLNARLSRLICWILLHSRVSKMWCLCLTHWFLHSMCIRQSASGTRSLAENKNKNFHYPLH